MNNFVTTYTIRHKIGTYNIKQEYMKQPKIVFLFISNAGQYG